MHIIKPQALGLSYRPVLYRRRFSLCISGYLYVPFAQPSGGALWSVPSMWPFLTQEMTTPLIDEGIAKHTPEFLVHGHAFTNPAQRDAVAVRARLGELEKTLLVFGERYWDGRKPSEPAPFEQMPLGWEQAYGGPDYVLNPVGKGHKPEDGMHWLPNVVSPKTLLLRPEQQVEPVGFAALDAMHPQRAALHGTYDDIWLKEHSPGFAPDLDWNHFNMAPRDQWFNTALRGDEPFAFDNMHPTQTYIEGALPGLCVRVFANYGTAEDADLREVPMRLTTVWCFPHAERLVLIFHGMTEVTEDDAADVRHLIGGVDRIDADEQRDAAHYREVFQKRTQGEDAGLHSLNDADLLPPGVDTADPDFDAMQNALKTENLMADARYRRAQIDMAQAREQARAKGHDPDKMGLRLPPREKPPTMAELPAYMAKARKEMKMQQWVMLDNALTHAEQMRDLVKNKKVDPEKLIHRGPPEINTAEQLELMRKSHGKAGKPFDEKATVEKLQQAEAAQRYSYLRTAHTQTPALRLKDEAARFSRWKAQWLLDHNVKWWMGMDFTGADLSNLDLRGIDFTGAWLGSANFSGANLSEANLTAAVLAHADLSGATAVGTNFQVANLGATKLEQAVFDKANLSGAILSKAHLKATRLHGVLLDGAELHETLLEQADWHQATGAGLIFLKLDMSDCSFTQAALKSCVFSECTLRGTDFSSADLTFSSFVNCQAEGANFSSATLTNAAFTMGSNLANANFSDAILDKIDLAECEAGGACFVRARLDAALLGQTRLSGCDMRLASAKGALLSKAVLQGATLAGVDFKDAILQNVDLRGADLRGAHLFGADLSRARLDADSRFEDAVFERTRTYPRRPLEDHAELPRELQRSKS